MPKTRKPSDKERRATAYHEAGHAVITIAQGLEIHKVSIVPGEGYNGFCEKPGVSAYLDDDSKDRKLPLSIARKLIIGIYAGMPAERLVDPDAPDSHGADDDKAPKERKDLRAVVPRGSFPNDEYHNERLDKLRAEAKRQVKRHQHAIAKLAEALLERQELTHEEAVQIIRPLLMIRPLR